MKNLVWNEEPVFVLTSDVDWASEYIIEFSHRLLNLKDKNVTYFNTHNSKYLNDLKKKKIIDLLIHPNFLPKSSHGDSFEEIIKTCLQFAPGSIGFRSHRYFEVNDIFDIFVNLNFKYFSNICTRCEKDLKPILHRSGLLSLPIFFEDGCYLIMDPDLRFENIKKKLDLPGLKIFNFHPAHLAFNTPNFSYTRNIKDSLSREKWINISKKEIFSFENRKFGIRNFIEKIIEFLEKKNYKYFFLDDIYNIWFNSNRG